MLGTSSSNSGWECSDTIQQGLLTSKRGLSSSIDSHRQCVFFCALVLARSMEDLEASKAIETLSEEALESKVDYSQATDGTRVIHDDPWLEPWAQTLRDRYSVIISDLHTRYATYQWWKQDIINKEGSLAQFALGYESFGFHRVEGGLRYRDWAPGAKAVHLYGEFSAFYAFSH